MVVVRNKPALIHAGVSVSRRTLAALSHSDFEVIGRKPLPAQVPLPSWWVTRVTARSGESGVQAARCVCNVHGAAGIAAWLNLATAGSAEREGGERESESESERERERERERKRERERGCVHFRVQTRRPRGSVPRPRQEARPHWDHPAKKHRHLTVVAA